MPTDHFARSASLAELALPHATARITRFEVDGHTDHVFHRDDTYWLDLCVTPRPENARAGYTDRWGPHRFERLGELFLVPPREALHVRTEGGARQTSVICELAADAVHRWLDHDVEWTDRRLAAGLDIVSPHMRACLLRLAEEARQPGVGGEALAGHVAAQLAIEVARFCEALVDGPVTGGLASWRLRIIDRRLHEAGAPPTLPELAGLCNLSVRQLTRGFRASRGCSIGHHIVQTRIELAKRRLATGESIKAIAAALGFSSPSGFSFTFRRAAGVTPRQFRDRQLRQVD